MKTPTTRALAFVAAALAYGGLASAAVHAPANTSISNTATVNFTVGATTNSQNSNTDTFTVDELADVDVTRQSPALVTTLSPATAQAILFRVTNLGNGSEQFNLGGSTTLGADQFNTSNLVFYIDDGDGIFEPGAGDGAVVTSITLAAETFGDVWFVSDVPGGQADGDVANINLTATSSHGVGAPGSEQAGNGDGGVGLVFGNSGGDDVDTGAYQVANLTVNFTKSSSISDQFGGSQPVPGATITYTITVTTAGTATATAVNVQDDVPTNTTYVGGSIKVNTVAKTDANDAEAAPACDFNVNNPGGIYCLLGTLTGATNNTVTFQVTIN